MTRGRPKAPADAAAAAALIRIREFVAARHWSSADLALHVGISDTSAWRVLNVEPARWTDSFVKIHEFIRSNVAMPAGTPLSVETAIDNAVLGRRHATATLLRAIADMLERSPA